MPEDDLDAMTRRRFMRQAALAAEREPNLVASRFAAFRASRDWTPTRLAAWLGLDADQFAALALKHLNDEAAIKEAADRYGADPGRLAAVLKF